MTLEVSRFIREDFLQQNMFTPYDKYCPLYKTFWMMKVIVEFYNSAMKIVTRYKEVTWDIINDKLKDLLYKVMCLKFQVKAIMRCVEI